MGELDRLVRRASKLAAAEMAAEGGIWPTLIARTGDGKLVTISLPKDVRARAMDDKNMTHLYFKMQLRFCRAAAYVFTSEAWMLILEGPEAEAEAEIEALRMRGLRDHPGRIEVVEYVAENISGEQRIARQSIIRPSLEPPSLDDDLTFASLEDKLEGRFTGMLRMSAAELDLYERLTQAFDAAMRDGSRQM